MALTSVAQLVMCHPTKQKAAGSIPEHMPGLRAWSPVGARMRGNRSMFLSHISISLPLFFLLIPSL